MSQDHGLRPTVEHYACIIDILGRAGLLCEAFDFISCMSFKPDALVWRTSLGACKIHGNMELGRHAAKHILVVEDQDSAAYVLLSNIYAVSGRWADVANMRRIMKYNGLRKERGCSWIEVKRRVKEFVLENGLHSQTRNTYAKFEKFTQQKERINYMVI